MVPQCIIECPGHSCPAEPVLTGAGGFIMLEYASCSFIGGNYATTGTQVLCKQPHAAGMNCSINNRLQLLSGAHWVPLGASITLACSTVQARTANPDHLCVRYSRKLAVPQAGAPAVACIPVSALELSPLMRAQPEQEGYIKFGSARPQQEHINGC